MKFLQLIQSYREDIIKSTQELISIRSVEEEAKPGMPFGQGPAKALEYTLNLADEMGFETKNLDNYAGHADLGDGEEVAGVLVHLDVVPEGDGWDYPPYAGEIHDGRIYGRGTNDDKGPTIACMYAMKALKEAQVELNKKIRIIFGTNEETGWGCMRHYFQHEKAPDMGFTPDAEFPVIHGEKGIIVFNLAQKLQDQTNGLIIESLTGGNAPNMVPDFCQAIIKGEGLDGVEEKFKDFMKEKDYPLSLEKEENQIIIKAGGISAHGSTPEKGENAISYLMAFLGEILGADHGLGEFARVYNEKIAFQHFGQGIGCGLEDDVSGKLNFNPGMIKLENNEIRLTVNVRYPIKSSADEVYKGIREALKDTKLELIEGKGDTKPLYVEKDNFLVEKLMKVYRERTGDMDSQPITIGGGTYARAMDNAVAFGPLFPGGEDVAHQKNEYISIEDLMKISEIYAQALYELAK